MMNTDQGAYGGGYGASTYGPGMYGPGMGYGAQGFGGYGPGWSGVTYGPDNGRGGMGYGTAYGGGYGPMMQGQGMQAMQVPAMYRQGFPGFGAQGFGTYGSMGGMGSVGYGQGMYGQGMYGQSPGAYGGGSMLSQSMSGLGGWNMPDTWIVTEYWLIPGPFTGAGPQGYQRSDERIREDVHERLTRHGYLDARNIQAQVNNGEVTLTGTVDSRQSKRMAADMAESVSGVKDVHNNLQIQQPTGQQMGQMGQTSQSAGMTGSRR